MKRGWKLVVMLALLLTSAATRGSMTLFKLEHQGQKGTAVIFSRAMLSLTMCASQCAAVPQCRGFNWQRTYSVCEGLSSYEPTLMDANSNVYVPDIHYSWQLLEYSCPTCLGPHFGLSDWVHDCDPATGALVGVAALSSLDDLDYMLCASFHGLDIDHSNGAFFTPSETLRCQGFFSVVCHLS
ncbi:hypothetical protein C7M84_023893 [Penaeus vannamei]|uniref:Apple domain-containing protein n=1 Tax=Penaeus vannamei TaxID=6689 RepID=A0A3R7QLP2_PENVA|nr:hypothetical protein C7M84_023893 [Penaeus vannamei]